MKKHYSKEHDKTGHKTGCGIKVPIVCGTKRLEGVTCKRCKVFVENMLHKPKPIRPWKYLGKTITQEKLAKKLAEEFFDKHMPDLQPSNTFSLFELLMYPLIVQGIKKASKQKFNSPEKMAFFVLGFLSARLNIGQFEDLLFEQRSTESKKSKTNSIKEYAQGVYKATDKTLF